MARIPNLATLRWAGSALTPDPYLGAVPSLLHLTSEIPVEKGQLAPPICRRSELQKQAVPTARHSNPGRPHNRWRGERVSCKGHPNQWILQVTFVATLLESSSNTTLQNSNTCINRLGSRCINYIQWKNMAGLTWYQVIN